MPASAHASVANASATSDTKAASVALRIPHTSAIRESSPAGSADGGALKLDAASPAASDASVPVSVSNMCSIIPSRTFGHNRKVRLRHPARLMRELGSLQPCPPSGAAPSGTQSEPQPSPGAGSAAGRWRTAFVGRNATTAPSASPTVAVPSTIKL